VAKYPPEQATTAKHPPDDLNNPDGADETKWRQAQKRSVDDHHQAKRTSPRQPELPRWCLKGGGDANRRRRRPINMVKTFIRKAHRIGGNRAKEWRLTAPEGIIVISPMWGRWSS
jgi:hypothetical protein